MIKNVILKTLVIGLLFGGASLALAESDGQQIIDNGGMIIDTAGKSVSVPDMSLKARLETELKKTKVKAEVKAKAGIKDIKTNVKTEVKNIKEESADKIKVLRDQVKGAVEEKKVEVKTKLEERKTDIQEKRVDALEKRVTNRFEQMNRRFEATIERLGSIMTRVVTRIEKIKNSGGNTTTAEKFVADAKVSLDLAKTGLANLKTASETVVEVERTDLSTARTEARTSLANLARIAKEIEKNLRTTHVALEKAVGSLKGLSQLRTTNSIETKVGGEVNVQN